MISHFVIAGLNFIGSNFSSILDERLQSPIGFNIIFPGMLEYALDIGLDVPIEHHEIDNMLRRRNAELHRLELFWPSCNLEEKLFLISVCNFFYTNVVHDGSMR